VWTDLRIQKNTCTICTKIVLAGVNSLINQSIITDMIDAKDFFEEVVLVYDQKQETASVLPIFMKCWHH
jgi:hypothetical protein